MFYTYILISLKDHTHYYGPTEHLEKRLSEHNSGKMKFTKGHRPYKIQYFELFNCRKEAFAREKYFKSIDGYLWLKSKKII